MSETIKDPFSHSRLGQTLLLVGLLLTVTFLVQSRAGDLETMNFQGRLVDAQGQPIVGTRTVLFKIKEDSTVIWQQQKTVSFKNGVFSVVLGDGNEPLTSRIGLPTVHVFSGDVTKTYALSLTIDGATFADIPIKRVPTATNAGFLNGKPLNYFNPMSVKGDLIYLPSTGGDPASLGIGNTGQVLMVTASDLPAWQSLTSEAGDIVVGGAGGVPTTAKIDELLGTLLDNDGEIAYHNASTGKVEALTIGGDNNVLKSVDDKPEWTTVAALLKATVLSGGSGKILIPLDFLA